MENNRFIKLVSTYSIVGTISIDDLNTKIKVAVFQERQDWEPPQIKDLKLVISEHCKFMAANT